MAVGSDYFSSMQELLENAEEAYADGNYDEAAEYIEELRVTAASCLDELERAKFREEVEEEDE